MIMDYNRVVKDLNGMTEEEFLGKMNDLFEVGAPQKKAVHPAEKGSFSMYLGDNWYACRMKEADLSSDPVDGLDVSIYRMCYCIRYLALKTRRPISGLIS